MAAVRNSIAGPLATVLLVVASPAAIADDTQLAPDDFAWGRVIELRDSGALHRFEVDPDVYRGSVEPNLADLRVFNSAGEVVPHAIRSAGTPRPEATVPEPLPFFPLPESPPATGPHRIDAEVSETGAILHLRSGSGMRSAPGSGRRGGGYLVDASALSHPVAGLDLSFAPDGADFVAPLQVEGSNDLVHFTPYPVQGVLVRLERAGHRIERSRVGFPASRHRYLRLRFPLAEPTTELTAVGALPGIESPPVPRLQTRVSGSRQPERPGVLLFDLEGSPPVDRIQVELSRANSLLEASLASAATQEGPFVQRFSGLLYDLEQAGRLRNPEIDWSPGLRHRYFEIEISPNGGGLAADDLELEVSWRSEELVFVARGEPPFRLAYGRADTAPSRLRSDALDALTGQAGQDRPIAMAALGPRFVLGGPDRLVPRPKPLAPRTLLLWAILIASVATVGLLAARLLRRMS